MPEARSDGNAQGTSSGTGRVTRPLPVSLAEAARIEADAVAAVTVARLALQEVHLAAPAARLGRIDAGEAEPEAATVDGYVPLAGRVRAALNSGARLWHLLVIKNLALVSLVAQVGFLLSALLAWRAGEPSAFPKACALMICFILLWLGVGNVLSVFLFIRDEPIRNRRRSGGLKQFLIPFTLSYLIGYLVNLMLICRVEPKVRRELLREITDYNSNAEARAFAEGVARERVTTPAPVGKSIREPAE